MALKKIIYNFVKDVLPDKLLIKRGNSNLNSISLTFDDGPYPENTEKILKILRKHNIKATFFMNGTLIEQHKEEFVKVIKDGHEIGNHLFNHISVSDLSMRELDREIMQWQKSINEKTLLKNKKKLFRPPYGRLDFKTLWYAWKHNWTIVLWSVDTRDYDGMSLEENVELLKSIPIRRGDIILFHDDSEHIEGLLECLIKIVKAKGLGFTTIAEMLQTCR